MSMEEPQEEDGWRGAGGSGREAMAQGLTTLRSWPGSLSSDSGEEGR